MRAQQPRTDILPVTWEIPAAVAACWASLAVLVLPAAQGLLGWVVGDGFAWPHGRLPDSVAGLLAGRTGVGLPPAQRAALPDDAWIYAGMLFGELLLAATATLALAWWWRTCGPGTQWGIGRRDQVRAVLGPGNLRRRRATIRPDLYRARPDNVRRRRGKSR